MVIFTENILTCLTARALHYTMQNILRKLPIQDRAANVPHYPQAVQQFDKNIDSLSYRLGAIKNTLSFQKVILKIPESFSHFFQKHKNNEFVL